MEGFCEGIFIRIKAPRMKCGSGFIRENLKFKRNAESDKKTE
jgi:hypothetical protein